MRIHKHVGIYGGTFDPIHFGHLNTAIEIMEAHQLDEIWFCPALVNPDKLGAEPTLAYHRLKMLEIALQELPYFGIIPYELERPGPSYTIDTLREIIKEEKKEAYPSKFYLIMGEDTAFSFVHWKEAKEILTLATPLICRRYASEQPIIWEGDPEICAALQTGMTSTYVMEISASRIRERVSQGLYIGHLVPAKVIDYIYQNHLYSSRPGQK
ncbi:putative nicotinate-nucleotide adenylyltransferase [Neochlamydia sp. TUME1]|uniref:nicotinate-nucleotide adenylyltransferase n=1 Tax=Neochlamydia sp. TUME1 TaxID=1478174 RepID=UPI000582C648|nr:nicotinate-nucleotide adenylyltransferase [Neochlamydia sp. TUME1]KIC76636.1 putative nicotinate-nucleotide adenylyltransferase [Neochlamydia sp. TUME1]